LKLTKFNT